MVNGKPNLTFGGAAPVSNTKARQRSYVGGRNADSFASYLPAELSRQVQAPQQSNQPALGPAGIPTRRSQPQQTPPGQTAQADSTRSAARTHMGFLPDNYLSSAVPAATQAPGAANAMPAGQQSRAQARNFSQPGNLGMMQTGGIQPQRVAKSAPRVSGTPITGRYNFGMVDTRKPENRPQTNQPALKAPPRNIAAVPAQAQTQQPFPGAAPGNSAYTRYTTMLGNFSGLQSPQSFVSHGFAGQNAELALKKLGYDIREASTFNTYARKLEPDPYALKERAAPPAPTAAARPAKQESRAQAQAAARKNTETLPAGTYPERSLVPTFYSSATQGLGNLAAKFESGAEGIAAIGYDRKGGTSYGKYQIASRVGTMDSFISYLQKNAPDIAQRLLAAGPANTGGRNGKMPAEWRKIAEEDPQRFEKLQSDFIMTSHFKPAMRSIADATGISFEQMPVALQEVLFSTAVQHGPAGATRIFSQAVDRVGAQKLQGGGGKKSTTAKKAEEQLITHIYNLRASQFVSSTSGVQSAVRNRLKQEMREAIQMLA